MTVTGTATVAVKPDTARVSFAVKAAGADFKTAAAECDKKAATIEKAIKDLKLTGLEVKKGPLNYAPAAAGGFGPGFAPMPGGIGGPVGPPPMGVPGPGPGGPGPFPGGWAPNTVEVTRTFTVIAAFGKSGAGGFEDMVPVADKILAAAITNGATETPVFNPPNSAVYGGFGPGGTAQGNSRVEFYRASTATLRQDALKAAVADALANAKVAAGVANLTTKDIVTITDQNQYGGPFGMGNQASNTGRGEVLGEMELTVQVSVTFNY